MKSLMFALMVVVNNSSLIIFFLKLKKINMKIILNSVMVICGIFMTTTSVYADDYTDGWSMESSSQQQSRERYFAVTGSTCYTGDNRTYCCFSSPEHYASYRSEKPNARPEGNESGLEYTGACAKLESQQAAEQQQQQAAEQQRQAAEQQWRVEEQQWQNSQQQYDQNGYPVGVSSSSYTVGPGGQLIPQPQPVRPVRPVRPVQ